MIEVCHGIAPVAQPKPFRNEGGDCFCCALTAALSWMFPEREFDFDAVWDCFVTEYHDGKAQENLQRLREAVGRCLDVDNAGVTLKGEAELERLRQVYAAVNTEKPNTTVCNTWGRGGMERAIKNAAERLVGSWNAIDIRYEILQPEFQIETWSHAWFAHEPVATWTESLERWLSAGYVAMSEQNYNGDGQLTADLKLRGTDHFVLIDGIRYGWEPIEGSDSRTINHYAHVVCSTGRGAYWIDVRDLMRRHGTAGLMFVRRSRV